MKRLQSILFAALLTLSVSSAALAGNISGRTGNISGGNGNISGAPSEITDDLIREIFGIIIWGIAK